MTARKREEAKNNMCKARDWDDQDVLYVPYAKRKVEKMVYVLVLKKGSMKRWREKMENILERRRSGRHGRLEKKKLAGARGEAKRKHYKTERAIMDASKTDTTTKRKERLVNRWQLE
ncbi:uncharacterized protein SPSK_04680 [Sporothrix schenckii 1099-18]|uniref:Uncharacterized protein n=1 Tax=Sporothrix schenckii 1099-18 TaxID=1397361 RepID=A0A0F2LZZ3_SPOSC|nr:uncharacterized protein SPSK_04680 [Sporothrix schenckii 1099-18]KJR83028.1 hypothetical protein SPSK_04680 [Sporothrix schenckii 1099-18]